MVTVPASCDTSHRVSVVPGGWLSLLFLFLLGKSFLRCQAYPVAEEKCLVRQPAMFSAREGQDARLLSAWHLPQARPAVA